MYPLIINKVFNEPWLLLPSVHRGIQQQLLERMHGYKETDFNLDERLPNDYVDYNGRIQNIKYFKILRTRIAIIPIYGIVGKHLSSLEMMCGGASLDHALHGLELAARDESITHIVLDLSTPGGTSIGVPELGRMIRKISAIKPVIAYTENMACSAGMWIASQCTHIIATPSAKVGSIGVYMTWFDDTAMMENAGRKLMLFQAGKHKAMGIRPLTPEEEDILQNRVEEMHKEFKDVILSVRDVPLEAMEGLCYSASEAIDFNLVDSLVDSFDEALDMIEEAS